MMFLHVCGSSLGVWERFSHTLTQSSRTRPRGRGNDVGACVFHVVPVHRGPRTGNADYFRGRSSEERLNLSMGVRAPNVPSAAYLRQWRCSIMV